MKGFDDLAQTGAKGKAWACAACAVVVAIIAAFVCAATFLLYPYGSKSQVMWDEFRKQDNLDTICIGTSLGMRSYNPMVVDAALGTKSFNMCTPRQNTSESYLGLEEALKHHDIKRVYYALDFSTLWMDYQMYPGSAYLNEKWAGDAFFQRFADLAYALPGSGWESTEKSLNWLFPWTEQRVAFNAVARNAQMKLNGTPVVEAAEFNEPGWKYYGQGYGNYEVRDDYNVEHHENYTRIGLAPIQDANMRFLGDICDLCAEHGIELVMFAPPIPDFGLIEQKDYYSDYTTQVKAFAEAHGAAFYDFNLAKPGLFKSEEGYFGDWEHCNTQGALAFSASFARLLQLAHSGQDTTNLFMSYDERLASIDHISVAQLQHDVTNEGIELAASCLAGSRVKAEYQFAARLRGSDAPFQVVQDYSESNTCVYKPSAQGVYEVRVNVRKQGSGAEFEKYLICEVAYV